jgi:hypothetical protein
MDDALLRDISTLLMHETVSGGVDLGQDGRDALKRIMVKVDPTVAVSRTLYVRDAIDLRLRELLCLPPAA